MHIVDGALSPEVAIGGIVLAAVGVGLGLKNLPVEKIPAAGVLGATFFVASLLHIPLGPTSVHLELNGLAGLVLGWAVFPAVLVGLLLQAVFFGFGGLTVLGINTLTVSLPAVLIYYLCRQGIRSDSHRVAVFWGALGGGLAIVLTAILTAGSLVLTGEEFLPQAQAALIAHMPLMVIEAFLTGAAVFLVRRVKPELFQAVSQGA